MLAPEEQEEEEGWLQKKKKKKKNGGGGDADVDDGEGFPILYIQTPDRPLRGCYW